MSIKKVIGDRAEEIANNYLQKQGLKLIGKNYRCRLGEIDLIMQDKDTLVFVEVRCRKSNLFGGAAGSVTFHKQTKLIRAAQLYLQQQKQLAKLVCRFDVVAITSQGPSAQVEWIKHAFMA